jgi:hypothetical protein
MTDLEGSGVAERPFDERLLLAGAISLYHDRNFLDEDAAVLRTLGYRVYVLDASHWLTTGNFHAGVRLMLNIRGRYVENLDGFSDGLTRLELSPGGRAALIFLHFDVFARQCRILAQQVLDVIETQSRRFLVNGNRLIAFVQSDSPTLEIEPVGAVPVTWNSREWQLVIKKV